MNFVSKLFFLVLIIVGASGSALAADAPPRLWEVTGKNVQGVTAKFYVLAVTHNGLDVEFDAYFRDKVIPALDQSNIFSFEGASLAASQVSECPNRLEQTERNVEILRSGRDRVRAAYLRQLNSGEQPTGLSEEIQAAARESKKNIRQDSHGWTVRIWFYPGDEREFPSYKGKDK